MARKAKKNIIIPESLKVDIKKNYVTVSNDKNTIKVNYSDLVNISIQDNQLCVKQRLNNKKSNAFEGLYHSLIKNAVIGLTEGFKETLILQGVGYRAQKVDNGIQLSLGFSHPIIVNNVDGIVFILVDNTTLQVSGYRKDLLGQVVANILKYRPAKRDPYKNKGVLKLGQVLRKKQGKKVK